MSGRGAPSRRDMVGFGRDRRNRPPGRPIRCPGTAGRTGSSPAEEPTRYGARPFRNIYGITDRPHTMPAEPRTSPAAGHPMQIRLRTDRRMSATFGAWRDCRGWAVRILPPPAAVPDYSRPRPRRNAARTTASAAPTSWAKMKPGASSGLIPENVSVRARATVTAGLANDVEAVNQ